MAPLALASDGGSDTADDESPDGFGGPSDGGQSSGDGSPADGQVSTAERVAMAVSVVLTLALFSFVAWNAVAGAGQTQPRATLDDVQQTDDGRTVHTVRVSNPGDRGFERATVLVACGDPPREVVLEHLPPRSVQTATVACPSGAIDPPTSVVSWQSG